MPERRFRRQVMVNTAWSGASNAWAMLVAFLSVPAMLHGLGAETFGTWVLLQTFSATSGWMSLADIGVVVSTTREVGVSAALSDGTRVRRLASASLLACTGLGVVAGSLLASIGTWVLPVLFDIPSRLVSPMRAATIVFSVQIVFDLLINAVEGVLEGLHRVDVSRELDMVRRTVVVGGSASVAFVTGDLVATAVVSAGACGMVAVAALLLLGRHVPGCARRPLWADARYLIRQGRELALIRPLGVVRRTMDRVIAGVILGPAAVTLVEIATQLQAAADAVLSSTSYAVVPASSWVGARDDKSALAELGERGTRYSMLATLPVVVAVGILAGPVVELWLGSKYSDAAALASVAVLAVGVTSLVAVGSQLLVGANRARFVLRAAVVSLSLNLALSVVLAEVVGIVGVFIGTLIAAAAEVPLLGRPILRAAGISGRDAWTTVVRPVMPPVLAQSAVTGAVLWGGMSAWWTVIIGGAAGLLAFAVVALVTAVSGDELRKLRSEFRPS